MRIVALDLGSRISYCEVKDGQVVERATETGLDGLVRLLGPNTSPAPSRTTSTGMDEVRTTRSTVLP